MITAEPTTSILVVDDQPQNLLALEAILEPLGQRIVRATSGTEALKHVLATDFAVILLDVQMPGMDGFETAALLKQRERSRHIPIIFLTALNKDASHVFKGYDVGAVDYIAKPFDPQVLRSKVSVFVELFRKNERIKQQAELIRQRGERDVAEANRRGEIRYRTLAESMPHIVWTADAEGRLTYCNRRWLECAGVPDETTATNLGWRSIVHPDDYDAFVAGWSAAVRDRTDWEGEFRFGAHVRGRDRHRWHLVRALAVRDESGRVTSWIGTSTDIDDRRRATEALRFLAEVSEVLASAFDVDVLSRTATMAVPTIADACLVDLAGDEGPRRVASVTELGELDAADMNRIFPLDGDGGAPVRVMASGKREVVSTERDPAHAAVREAGIAGYASFPLVARRHTLGAITFVFGSGGRATDVVLLEDVARRVALAVDNAQLYAIAEAERVKLEAAHKAKDEFLATLSHELRTPLNSMLGWIHLVRGGDLDPDTVRRGMETIERNTRVQAQLINDLLDISRIVTGKLHIEMREVPIHAVLEGAVDAVRPIAENKGVRLEADIARVGTVWGDPDRLQQVAWNLLSNAVKFTPSGGKVRLVASGEGGHVRFTVADDGQGISADFLPYVFDRFRQADGSNTRAHGGLGLGLAIVAHIVKLHSGTVEAASEGLGKGARFVVDLPLYRQLAVPPAAPSSDEVDPSSTMLAGVHVLVVDDEPDGREMMRAVLERNGARVTTVGSAAEALDAVATLGPDVLLCDIALPGEDGYSLIGKIRALGADRHGDVPAAALTAFAAPEDRERALDAGFHAHVAKPIEPDTLIPAVATLAQRRKRPEIEGRVAMTA